jgi:hypothetical protein
VTAFTETAFIPTSHGNGFGPDSVPLGELRDSARLAGDESALRERMAEDGYLLLRRFLDREQVLAARAELCAKLAGAGLLDSSRPLTDAIFSGSNNGLGQIDRKAFAKDLRTGPALRSLLQQGQIIRFFETFLRGPILPFAFIWVRNVRPGGATGCHYDWVYMGRGTRNLYTTWTPIGPVPFSDGPLAILEGSHRFETLKSSYGSIDVDRDKGQNPYDGGWLSKDPGVVHQRYGGRWLSAEFEPGDMLLFGMFTLHCSLDNKNPEKRIRLSTDTRYQLASEPADGRWVGEEPFGEGMD